MEEREEGIKGERDEVQPSACKERAFATPVTRCQGGKKQDDEVVESLHQPD